MVHGDREVKNPAHSPLARPAAALTTLRRQSWKSINAQVATEPLIKPTHIPVEALMGMLRFWMSQPSKIRAIKSGESIDE